MFLRLSVGSVLATITLSVNVNRIFLVSSHFLSRSASFHFILEAPVQKEVERVVLDRMKGVYFPQRSNLVYLGA